MGEAEPYFSLVVSTVGRPTALHRLLETLDRQDAGLELILVDQDLEQRSKDVVASRPWRFPVTYVDGRDGRGLSKGRNEGLSRIRGRVVGFPDDDVWYPPDLLARVREHLEDPTVGGLSVPLVTPEGEGTLIKWAKQPGKVDRWNMPRRVTSGGLFIKSSLVLSVGGFNEELGAGADSPWGAGEELDYVARLLKSGTDIRYEPRLHVFQEEWLGRPDPATLGKVRRYNRGFTRALKMNGYPLWFVGYYLLRQLGALALALVGRNADRRRIAVNALMGRIEGLRGRSWAAAHLPAAPADRIKSD